MNDNKIYIDSLPCKISWTTTLLLISIVVTLATGVLNAGNFSNFALIGDLIAGVFWCAFFFMFANSCKNLPHRISTATVLMVLTWFFATVLLGASKALNIPILGIIGGVLEVAILGSMFWLGNSLSKYYSSTLGEIGSALKKIVKLYVVLLLAIMIIGIIGILASLAGIFIFAAICEILLIVAKVVAVIVLLWIIWLMFDDVILPIYQMLNWGNSEGVTQTDIKNWVKSNN